MSTVAANNYLYLLMTKQINFLTDTFNIILMNSSFSFNRATMVNYSNVSSSELPTGNGYTVGGNVLTGVAVTTNNILNLAQATWATATWNCTGTVSTNGACILDMTVSGSPIVGYIDFGGTQITYASGVASIANPTVVNAG